MGTLGAAPDLSRTLADWINWLSGGGSASADLAQQSARLAALLSDKEVLLVLDSVTESRHAELLLQAAGPKCVTLLTTRDRRTAEECGANPSDIIRIGTMTPSQALSVLGASLTQDDGQEDTALTLADFVGYLPLSLRILRGQHSDGASWTELLKDLREHADQLFEVEDLDVEDLERHARLNLIASIYLSVKKFSSREQCWFCLAWRLARRLQDQCAPTTHPLGCGGIRRGSLSETIGSNGTS